MKRYCLFILLSVVQLCIYAQDFRFDHLTADDGLGDNFVRRLFEDSYGFIWIGTKDGLSRFDGYNTKTYKIDKGKPNTLPSGYIGAIAEDCNKNLWIGTGNGLVFFEREYDRFKTFLFKDPQKNSIHGIVSDSIYLWISTANGLCKFNTLTHQDIWYFSSDSKIQNNSKKTRVSRLVIDAHNFLWISFADDNGIIKFNPKTGEFVQFVHSKNNINSIPGNQITTLYRLNDSILLLGFKEEGAYKFNIHSEIFTKIFAKESKTPIGLSMPWKFYKDSDKNVWVGCINGGLFMFNETFTESQNFIPDEYNPYSLNSISVSEIMQDKFGNLWFGTHSGGLNIIYKRKSFFNHISKTSNVNGLSFNTVSCFFESEPGKIWIGTDGGGLNLLESNKKNKVSRISPKLPFPTNAILSIEKYDKNKLLISTWDKGIVIYDYQTNEFTNLKYDKNNSNSISYPNIKHAFRKGDSLIILTHGAGINYYNIKTKKIISSVSDSSKEFLSIPESCNKGILDKKGNLWISTNMGLFKLKDDILTTYIHDTTLKNTLSGNYITDLCIDSKNRLWVTTLTGLNLFNETENNFQTIFPYFELNRAIMSIVEDDNGCLWMGTNTGIIQYNPNEDFFAHYNQIDGLQGNQFYERAAYKDSKGNLYFGGMNGMNVFNPNLMQKDSIQPFLYFGDFKIFNKSIMPSENNSVLHKHINYTDEITLDYSQKVITIEFIALHYLSSLKNEYAYFLEGFDDSWYYVNTTRSATYTNLAPGKYIFRVKACNADKIWTKSTRDIVINILPPWWQTWWVKLFAFVFIIISVLLIFYLKVRSIKKQNRELEQKVHLRTAELEENKEELQVNNEKLIETIKTKDRFFSIIAHDLKNPLNASIGFSDLLVKKWGNFDDSKKFKYLELINSSSLHLSNLLTNLLDWSRAQTGTIMVKIIKFTLYEIIIENIQLLQAQANNKEITINNDIDENLFVYADKDMIDTVIRNIISNAIKFTPRKGVVNVSARRLNKKIVEINISDNGVGMDEKKIKTLFKVDKNSSTPGTESEKGSGLGLLVCNEFISINNGTISVSSKPNAGTRFSICLPTGD